MEIIVQGKGESSYAPNQVVLNLRFMTKGATYDEVLAKGSKEVMEFVDNLLLPQGFAKEDMKTNNFNIRRETKHNETTRNHESDGFSFNQTASIKFDYDKERLSRVMEETSKLPTPPFYEVNFTVKDLKACKQDNLSMAYKDAEEQARIIAEAAGKSLKNCAKVDFKPFTTEYTSKGYEAPMGRAFAGGEMFDAAKMSTAETINAIFTPEDVAISETLYCLWIAE